MASVPIQDINRLLNAFRQEEIVSDAKQKYDATFGSEQKLNKEFRMFVRNYQKAFEQDLSRKQSKSLIMISKHSQPNIEAKHCSFNYFFNVIHTEYFGAGVVLPQGPSFNSLVKHFSKIAKKETNDLLRCIAVATIDGPNELCYHDSADALTALLE